MLEAVAIYVAAGLLAGFVSGLFGVGGAFTMTPALIIALPLQGVADSQVNRHGVMGIRPGRIDWRSEPHL